MTRGAVLVVLAVVCAPAPAGAQSVLNADVVTPPANVLLPNYDSVPVGPNAGLEGSAYVARVSDPSAAWLNPAGLGHATASEVSGSSGLFQISNVSPSALPDTGGSVQQLPSVVGFTAANVLRQGFTLGLSVLTSSSWTQDTNSQLTVDRGTARERFAYSADSEFQQHVGAGSVGYASGRLRLGGGLAFVYTDVVKNDVISDRLGSPTSLRSLIIETRASGSAFQMRPLFGAQFDVSPHVHLGGMIRTPALTLYKSASATEESLAENGSASIGASFFDSDADFTYRQPFEFHGGVAYTAARGEIELDVHAYTPISAYAMIASDQPIVTYTNPGAGAAPGVSTRPFGGAISQSRGIANVAVGGHLLLNSNGVWRLHYGAATDFSPVGAEDKVFTKLNRFGWSIGISGTKGPLQFTAGVNYRSGSSEDIVIRNLQNGEQVTSTISVQTLGLIYSLSYKF
jgi:hypothetical protein